MSNEKKWNPKLWKPVGMKEVDLSTIPDPEPKWESDVGEKHSFLGIIPGDSRKTNSFLDYQAPDDRYEVRGIMPKAPERGEK